jgi:hypothetical protein
VERDSLSTCHGYGVLAQDGVLGHVETPLFPPDGRHPDFLVIRVRDAARLRFPVVHVSLVRDIDQEARLIRVGMRRRDAASLPEQLPLGRPE